LSAVVCWYSGGVTSTVATKLTLEKYDEVEIIFFETGNHHPDNKRYFKECEKWFKQSITTLQHEKFGDIYSVFKNRRFINSPYGAPCTQELKKKVRQEWERKVNFKENYAGQIFGFEAEPKEIMRAQRFEKEFPYTNPIFPLIDADLTKEDCLKILKENNIDPPIMYQLGYANNNCVGCVKGGMGYWNKIRVDFPEVFEKTAALEREIGASCINGQYLDELDPSRGRMSKPYVESCGSFCDNLDGTD
jgi:3'-phosphoadenosine 5'-phosphosulfate sulfotransferase (PAPS reductase)/FAD synthetase